MLGTSKVLKFKEFLPRLFRGLWVPRGTLGVDRVKVVLFIYWPTTGSEREVVPIFTKQNTKIKHTHVILVLVHA